MENRLSYIYGLECPIEGKIRYIGKTVDPENRLSKHIHESCRNRTHKDKWLSKLLQQNLRPKLVILEEVPEELSSEREIYWIAKYKSMGFKLTNGTPGGDGAPLGFKHTEEAKRKIAEAGRGRKYPNRPPLSIDARKKISKANLGRKNSQESIEKMREAHRGKVYSFKSRQKMSLAHKGVKLSEEHIKNSANSRRGVKKPNSSSKYIGVYWDKIQRKWTVRLRYDRKTLYFGGFIEEVDAAHVYDSKIQELYGENVKLNFPK
jgi:group I intron endonuclease